MSWNGFVKAVSRAKTSVMQSAGAAEKTIDKQYQDEEARVKQLEKRINSLYEEASGYLDAGIFDIN